MFDYLISPQTKAAVVNELNSYPWYEMRVRQLDEEIIRQDYALLPTTNYDRITISKTNQIPRAVENFVISTSDKRSKRDAYVSKMNAIKKGIERAAETCDKDHMIDDLCNDLYLNMVEKMPREVFDRHPRTFTKYRKRAFYYIAVELGYIEDAYE